MSESGFGRLPTELIEEIAHVLELPDLKALRLTCTQVAAQTSQVIARRLYSTVTTNLIGWDLEKLQWLGRHEQLRRYVKEICVEDYCLVRENSNDSLRIWPKDEAGVVIPTGIEIERLKAMFVAKRICPERIKVRYHEFESVHSEYATSLAKDICEGSDLAILSITVSFPPDDHIFYRTSEVVIDLSPQHQGQGIGFKMLRYADFRELNSLTSYWADRVFLQATSLTELVIAGFPRHFEPSCPLPMLKRLHLYGIDIKARCLKMMLANSRHSLTDLSLSCVTLTDTIWQGLLASIGNDFSVINSFNIKCLLDTTPIRGHLWFTGLCRDGIAEEYDKKFVYAMPDVVTVRSRGSVVRFDGGVGWPMRNTLGGLEVIEKGPRDNIRMPWVRYKGQYGSDVLKILAECITYPP